MTRAAVFAAALLAAAPAAADTLNWLGARLPNGPGEPWPYAVDARDATPGGLPLADVEAAMKAAYQNWEDASCAYVSFTYTGRDTVSGPKEGDGVNLMGTFIESAAQDDELYKNAMGSGAAVAVALVHFYGGTIYGCDVAFNAVDYGWATNGDAAKIDLLSVANQETGHCLGLDHYTGDYGAVMYPFVQPGVLRRALRPHDVDNICQVYPQSGQVGSPCTGTCPNGLTCVDPGNGKDHFCTRGCDPAVANACPVGFSCTSPSQVAGASAMCTFGGSASVLVGAPCTRGNDCGPGGLCFQESGTDWLGGYCTADCTSNPCPSNSTCYDDFSQTQKLCMKDCRPGFGDCRSGYACEPLPGGQGRCRPACTSATCATCRTCDGLCVHPGKAGAAMGDWCKWDSDCPEGATCRTDIAGGTCTMSCASKCATCPAGASCQLFGAVGEQLCFKTCASGADCRSGLGCVGGTCRPGCTKEADCPVGTLCVSGSCVARAGPEAGCAACGAPDSGATDAEPPDSGAVVEEPPVEPCGCSTAGASGLATIVGLLAFALRRRGER